MKHTFPLVRRAVLYLLLAILLTWNSLAIIAQSVPDELQVARDRLKQAVDNASGTMQRSLQLENRLKAYDQKVLSAKRHVEELNQQKQDVRGKIAGIKELTHALEEQLIALNDDHAYRENQLLAEKDNLKDFVRYVALQNIVITDTGPAAGGEVLHRLLRGSLGDIIEQDLHRTALTRAREQVLKKLTNLESENEAAQQRVQQVAFQLSDQVAQLETLYHNLDIEAEQGSEMLDVHMASRELTQEELDYIKQSMAEEQMHIAAMQREMIQIQSQLKDFKLGQVDKTLRDLAAKKEDTVRQQHDLSRQREILVALQASALKAFNAMKADKSTDRKLYQRAEKVDLDITNKKARLEKIQTLLTGSGTDNMRAFAIERDDLKREIPQLEDKLAFMNQGYGEDAVDTYIVARSKARDADHQIDLIDEQTKQFDVDTADLDLKIAAAKIEYDKVSALTIDMPPMYGFIWPVRGRITAGFHDPHYYAVYHVEHQAIDIATPQGSPVYATSDGVVYTVKDGGAKGYSYILIGHSNGYASLYGHMSRMFVSKGDIVAQGQVIGLSGGTPGTAGAGWMTSGPHLHFEMIVKGQRIDPRNVLR